MTRKWEKAKFPKRFYDIHLRLTGAQKNEIIDYAKSKDLSVNQLILYAVLDFIRTAKGIPAPGPSQYAKASLDDVLISYLRGERILQPCGKTQCEQVVTEISGMEFCTNCNLRIG